MNPVHLEVLAGMAQTGAYKATTLSQRTGLSEPLIEQLVAELHELGYIEPLGGEPDARCVGCRFAGQCERLRTPGGWTLTERALSVLDCREPPIGSGNSR